jgi:hypothetical protein
MKRDPRISDDATFWMVRLVSEQYGEARLYFQTWGAASEDALLEQINAYAQRGLRPEFDTVTRAQYTKGMGY